MRRPSSTLVIDAAILISAVYGRGTDAILRAARSAALATTDRVIAEARRRIELGMKRPELLAPLGELVTDVAVIPVGALTPTISAAERALREATPSRNGSVDDAHVLALAWELDADVWTTDRDFAGAGVATWSTPNLMRALAEVR